MPEDWRPSGRVWLGVGKETDPGVADDIAAGDRAIKVVAGDPEARGGAQHVVRAEPPGPAVAALRAVGVPQQRPARGEPAQARRRYRARARFIAARWVVRPPLVPADVNGAGVGGGRVQRVAAGVVHPLRAEPAGPGRG